MMGLKIQSDFKMDPMIENSAAMFQDIVSRGILQMGEDGFYQISIPSLRTWILEEYQSYLNIINHKPSHKIQRFIDSIPLQ